MKCPNCGGQKKLLVRKRKKLPRKKASVHVNHPKKNTKPRKDFNARCLDCGFDFNLRNHA